MEGENGKKRRLDREFKISAVKMIFPKLRSMGSPDLQYGSLPKDTENCDVFMEIIIGPSDGPGEEVFHLQVVTFKYLKQHDKIIWGRGKLIVGKFSWENVKFNIGELLKRCSSDTWKGVADKLSKYLDSEFDNYQEYNR